MKRYKRSIPRVACGLVALAMTTITVGALVVVPATLTAGETDMLAAATPITSALARGVFSPARSDVALPEPRLATAPCLAPAADRKPEG